MKSRLIISIIMGGLCFSGFSASPIPQLTTPVKIELNSAQMQDLLHIVKGVGQKRAAAIVEYREKHHGFQSIEELEKVPGLGKRFVETHLKELQAVLSVSKAYKPVS